MSAAWQRFRSESGREQPVGVLVRSSRMPIAGCDTFEVETDLDADVGRRLTWDP